MAATLRELRGADPLRRVDQEDHQGTGNDRDVAHGEAQARLQAARPYATEITRMLTTLAAEAALDHPLLVEHSGTETGRRAGGLV